MAGLVGGVPLSAAGVCLGVFTIWRGWTTATWNFVTRGSAIVAISILVAIVMSSLLSVRTSDAARAVSEMIDLAIARAHRTLIAIRLGLAACCIAAVMGLVGAAIRSYRAAPPRMSPVVDVAVLVMFAAGLFVYGRQVRITLEKLHALKRALGADGEA